MNGAYKLALPRRKVALGVVAQLRLNAVELRAGAAAGLGAGVHGRRQVRLDGVEADLGAFEHALAADALAVGLVRAGVAGEPEYLAEMTAHHQEAVMAGRELARSERVDMRSLGASIVKTQSAQIRQMRSWLREWYPEQPTTVHYRPMMRDLSGLSGERLDQAFLQDMIGHHMDAVMMSQHLLWRGADHDEVAELARSIRDDQHTEIVRMQRWLVRWFDADWRGRTGWGMCSSRADPWHGPRAAGRMMTW